MFAMARKQIAIPEQKQRGNGAGKDDVGRAGDWVIDAIEKGLGTKDEGLTGADEYRCQHGVLEVQEAGADVEATDEPVQSGLTGLEVHPGVVVDSVHAVGIVECEEVEAGTEIDAACERSGHFDARSERAGPEAECPGAEWSEFRGYRWCALRGNRANICAFGGSGGGGGDG